MSDKYIAGRQIPQASSFAKSLERIGEDLTRLQQKMIDKGFWEEAVAVDASRAEVRRTAGQLERKAREAFVAARRGEELPR